MTALEIFSLIIRITLLIAYAIVAIYSLNRFWDDDTNKPDWLIAALLALIAMGI